VAVRRYEEAAHLTNPAARIVALSLNTGGLEDEQAAAAIDMVARETGLAVTDPVRHGAAALADALLG
jgi:uncharacterized NAD-dependent epimerase/dehydratase family protein